MGVHGDLILGGITDKTFVVGEGNIRRSCAVSLVVGDDLNTIILPDANTPRIIIIIKEVKYQIQIILWHVMKTYE